MGDGVQVKFRPRSAYAEYLELPGLRNELRVTVSSYPTTCERYVKPRGDETIVQITLRLPPDAAPDKARYPSLGGAGTLAPDAKIDDATASVFVRHGKQAYSFLPGGVLDITRAKLSAHGFVWGEASFESAASSTQPEMQLTGEFRAGMCRFQATER